MNPERLGGHKDEPTKTTGPKRWTCKDGEGPEREAGMPRKLALWTHKDGFSYMHEGVKTITMYLENWTP